MFNLTPSSDVNISCSMSHNSCEACERRGDIIDSTNRWWY